MTLRSPAHTTAAAFRIHNLENLRTFHRPPGVRRAVSHARPAGTGTLSRRSGAVPMRRFISTGPFRGPCPVRCELDRYGQMPSQTVGPRKTHVHVEPGPNPVTTSTE